MIYQNSPINLKEVLKGIEAALIHDALKRCRNNQARAAKELGIKRTTLVEKLKRIGPMPTIEGSNGKE
jgi:sigma-54 specific flagellar transcriptional regulator A